MRQIKFRGRDIETGEYVYAELGQVSAEINPEYLTFITDDIYTVDTESVAQLVGIDSSGKEVYEDDVIVDQHGIECTAYLVGILDGETEFVRLDDEIEMASFEFKLKEE